MKEFSFNLAATVAQNTKDQNAIDYNVLEENAYLISNFNEMKVIFNKTDFESLKNPPVEMDGEMFIPFNTKQWPVFSSKQCSMEKLCITTKIEFGSHCHKMLALNDGSFQIKNASIKVKFLGNRKYHYFNIGEHDSLAANLYLGYLDDDETPQAFLVDYWSPNEVIAELEELTILATTNGNYYEAYKKPRALEKDLVIFTCFNKTYKVSYDTITSLNYGRPWEPKTIFVNDADVAIQAN